MTDPYMNNPDCPDCNKHKAWIEIVLVDEKSNPISDMPYTLTVSGGPNRTGRTNHAGIAREVNLPPTAGLFSIDAQSLADEMEKRPLRINRTAHSKAHYDAIQNRDNYRYVTIGDLCDSKPTITNWNEPELPKHHFKTQNPKGYLVIFRSERWVFEVCPFRAWSFLLHHQKDYSLTNACNLSILSVLAYADLRTNDGEAPNEKNYSGSIEDVFLNQCFNLSKIPTTFEGKTLTPIVYDVPFSERYTVIEFVDSGKNLDTQMYYVANNQEVIIGWRGTASMTDVQTDMTFKPIQLESDMNINGYVHSGFYSAFKVVNEYYPPRIEINEIENTALNKINELVIGKKLYIAGHSLGGALALLHAVKLRKYNPVLYTIGMPRVLTISVAEQLSDIIHHRHVNEDDAVPALPFEKDMNNFAFKSEQDNTDFLGYAIEIAITYTDWKSNGLTSKTIDYRNKKLNIRNDTFVHHGDAIHFYKQELRRNVYINSLPYRVSEKLYLVSELLSDHKLKKEFFELYKLPKKASPGLFGALNHLSGEYTNFIINKIVNLTKSNELTDSSYEIRAELTRQKELSKLEYDEISYLLDLDLMVVDTLLPTVLLPEGKIAIARFKYANKIY